MESADKKRMAIALLLVFLVVGAQPAFAFWPFWQEGSSEGFLGFWQEENSEGFWGNFFSTWLWGKPRFYAIPEPEVLVSFDGIGEEYGLETAEFAERIYNRFEKSFLEEELEGIAKIVENFPEGNGKAVLETMTDEEYGIWSRQALEDIAELDAEGELENFYFKGSQFAKIGGETVDGLARADYKDFFIETTAVRNRLTSASFLYSKVVRQSKRFREAQGQDITLVIVLKKGTWLEKKEIDKTLWKAFEKSTNLEMQNITRIALYDAGQEKTITVYSRQDWIDGKP